MKESQLEEKWLKGAEEAVCIWTEELCRPVCDFESWNTIVVSLQIKTIKG